jgi:hypothetical protein
MRLFESRGVPNDPTKKREKMTIFVLHLHLDGQAGQLCIGPLGWVQTHLETIVPRPTNTKTESMCVVRFFFF